MAASISSQAMIDLPPPNPASSRAAAPAPNADDRQRTRFRVLLVDDEPDIREIVELSLGLDPVFVVRSCASGTEAVAVAAEWHPDLILCDVMMPVMDGPTTLTRLRESPETARIPLVFMTARAQTRELEHFKSLGAAGVIAKPFDPMTLAALVREHLRAAGLTALREGFIKRLRTDAAALARYRTGLSEAGVNAVAIEQIKNFAHALAGVAGIFGFHEISAAAADLEKTTAAVLAGNGARPPVEQAIDRLLACITCIPGIAAP